MRTTMAVLLLLVCTAAAAQEIDIFDPTDFIDPRERGAVFRDRRIGVEDPGPSYLLTRLYGGVITDYQWRSTHSKTDPSFLHAATSYYRGDKQLNVKITAFNADHDANIPKLRTTVQLGQYFVTGPIARDAADDRRISARLLATWSMERNPYDAEDAVRGDRFNHEFGLQSDLRVPLPPAFGKLDSIDGSFIWMRRRIDDRQYVDRLSYLYRFRERRRSNGRFQFNASLGFGAERATGWHCCLARGVFTTTFVVPRLNIGVNAAFAPTFSPAGDGRRTHRELAIYLDRTVIARLADVMKD